MTDKLKPGDPDYEQGELVIKQRDGMMLNATLPDYRSHEPQNGASITIAFAHGSFDDLPQQSIALNRVQMTELRDWLSDRIKHTQPEGISIHHD